MMHSEVGSQPSACIKIRLTIRKKWKKEKEDHLGAVRRSNHINCPENSSVPDLEGIKAFLEIENHTKSSLLANSVLQFYFMTEIPLSLSPPFLLSSKVKVASYFLFLVGAALPYSFRIFLSSAFLFFSLAHAQWGFCSVHSPGDEAQRSEEFGKKTTTKAYFQKV